MARIYQNGANLWGRLSGLEAQRSDLWVVDFSVAANAVTTAVNLTDLTLVAPLPTAANLQVAARAVAFPEESVEARPWRRGTGVAVMMPGEDAPLGPMTITFLHPAQTSLPLYNFFKAWRQLVRAGRDGAPIDGSDTGAVLSSSSLSRTATSTSTGSWDYRADVNVQFLGGVPLDQQASDIQDALGGNNFQSTYWNAGFLYTMKDAWPSKIQMSDISYEQAALSTIRVTLQGSAFVQGTPTNVS